MQISKIIFLFLLMTVYSFSQGVIITEIANSINKKALYSGGEYIELQVVSDGVKLAGWYLTDFPSVGSKASETQGSIFFSDTVNSIFNTPLKKGTIVVVCLGTKEDNYGSGKLVETLSVDKSTSTIVVFPYDGSKSMLPKDGKVVMSGKDNISLLSKWEKKAMVDCVTWGREIKMEGCKPIVLPVEKLENGTVVYLKKGTALDKRFDAENWVSTTDAANTTPGAENK